MINTWTPLVDVGETAPGLTLVRGARRPERLWRKMREISLEGGLFDRTNRGSTKFSDADVEDSVANDPEAEFVTPTVPAGGAIVFDHQYLHRTQRLTPAMGVRDSVEFRVMSERVFREAGLDKVHPIARLY